MRETINNGKEETGLVVRTKLNNMFSELYQFITNATQGIADWDLFFPYTDSVIKLYTDVAITITEIQGDVQYWQYSVNGVDWSSPTSEPLSEDIAAGIFYIKAVFSTETAVMVVKAIRQ